MLLFTSIGYNLKTFSCNEISCSETNIFESWFDTNNLYLQHARHWYTTLVEFMHTFETQRIFDMFGKSLVPVSGSLWVSSWFMVASCSIVIIH